MEVGTAPGRPSTSVRLLANRSNTELGQDAPGKVTGWALLPAVKSTS